MPKKLLDQVSDVARLRHLSIKTERSYRNWIKRFILYAEKLHPRNPDLESIRQLTEDVGVVPVGLSGG